MQYSIQCSVQCRTNIRSVTVAADADWLSGPTVQSLGSSWEVAELIANNTVASLSSEWTHVVDMDLSRPMSNINFMV